MVPLRTTILLTVTAALLFILLFRDKGIAGLDFWSGMAAVNLFLVILVFIVDKDFASYLRVDVCRKVGTSFVVGIASAISLYIVFFIGNLLSRMMSTAAAGDINEVYQLKSGESLVKIVFLLATIIGPAEEFFWRGFLQRNLMARFGAVGIALTCFAYSAVHIPSTNVMLVAAAAVCGVFWGALFYWQKSLLTNIISHVLWDLLVFVILPFA